MQALTAATPPLPRPSRPLPTKATTANATIQIKAAAVASTATHTPKRRELTGHIIPTTNQPLFTDMPGSQPSRLWAS